MKNVHKRTVCGLEVTLDIEEERATIGVEMNSANEPTVIMLGRDIMGRIEREGPTGYLNELCIRVMNGEFAVA